MDLTNLLSTLTWGASIMIGLPAPDRAVTFRDGKPSTTGACPQHVGFPPNTAQAATRKPPIDRIRSVRGKLRRPGSWGTAAYLRDKHADAARGE
jgi:hypothetical protein